ncbi:hypothetical protein [Olleya sp. HaHaR_3_96]|uniref:DoxX family protein n=1 Tax=Olleya sp. HaHaR_3_96 TaxID=2745560 RepID=UPI001C4EC074|nr:hypothetical protein [Olleya sp. HaHaR_3_96]QXP61465.1 hypothetical protein H0I26_07485 [Olleya sp. HaHaR_3_96]
MTYPWHLYIMSALYVFSGMIHFIQPKIYLRVMPLYLPNHKLLVLLSGITEVTLGISLCIPILKNVAIYSIIVMLIVFLLVHYHMLSSKKASLGLPMWILLLRIPLQFILVYWAYYYLKL